MLFNSVVKSNFLSALAKVKRKERAAIQDEPESQSRTVSPGVGNRLETLVSLFLLVIILLLGARLRFQALTQQGICPGDGVKYTQEALRWATGKPPTFLREEFYRPVAHFLQGLALRTFGVNDYAIKLMHGLMDIVSILLLYRIAWLLTRSPWPGLAACLMYASLSTVVALARMEMLHTESTFFTLWAVFFFVVFIVRDQTPPLRHSISYFWLAGAGLSLGLAANTHADQALLAPGMVTFLFIASFRSAWTRLSMKQFLLTATIFSAAFFTPYVVGIGVFGFHKVLTVFSNEVFQFRELEISTYHTLSKPILAYRIVASTLSYFFGSHALAAGVLALGGVGIMIRRRWIKAPLPENSYLPLFLLLTYITLYTLLFSSFEPRFGRIMLPLLPLFLIFLFQWYYLWLTDLRRIKSRGRYWGTLGFIGAVLFWWGISPNTVTKLRIEKTEYRYVYDLIKTRVDGRNKMLVTPIAIVPYSRGFRCDLYFGEDAVYQNQLPLTEEYTLEALWDLLKNKSIRFVWVGNNADPTIYSPGVRIPRAYKPWLRNEKHPYSVEKDLAIVHRYIAARAGVLMDTSRFGRLYWLSDTPTEKENG